MTQTEADLRQTELGDLLEAYEHARAVEGNVDLLVCLPRDGHPLYREARRELVRLDLKYSRQTAQPKRLADYLVLFPDLLDDPQSAQDITYEDYRQRVLAGEHPSAAEYARLYRVNTAHWPGSDAEISKYPKTVLTDVAPKLDTETMANRILTPPLEWDMFAGGRSPISGELPSLSSASASALLRQNGPNSFVEVSFLLAQALTCLPNAGARFLDFHLIAELGRGGFGCVYLAKQGGLADRLVALKLTLDLQGEEQKLAQLQHTNVVPIYSAHTTANMHAVCMPYFGPTTLADVIRRRQEAGAMPATGALIVATIRARMREFLAQTGGAPAVMPGDAPTGTAASAALKMFDESSFVHVVLWLAERVTEGLMHAHEHGILHGDLKPANILLTDEGQPMLLDFNLATDIKVRAALGELRVGGTLPYMAPEHLDALQGGDKAKVDARSDVYGLGVILFELLTGSLPFENKRGPLAERMPAMIAERQLATLRLRTHNPAISPAVESIVRHCLEPDPARRYQSARELHEDLRRQSRDLPLRHAPEPSLRERASKWVRRHPHLTAPTNVIAACLILLAAIMSPGAWQTWQDWQADRQHLVHAKSEVDKANQKTVAVEKNFLSADQRARGAEARIRALNVYRDFHPSAAAGARNLVNTITLLRMRPEAWPIEQESVHQQATACRALLAIYQVPDNPDWQSSEGFAALPGAEQERLRADAASLLYGFGEISLLRATQLRHAKGQAKAPAAAKLGDPVGLALLIVDSAIRVQTDAAAKWNASALRCFAPDRAARALLIQQANLAALTPEPASASGLLARTEQAPLRSDMDDAYWTASALAAQNKIKDAQALLAEVTRKYSDHFGAWRLRGWCYQSTGEFRQAESCWDTCAALRPDDDWTRYCRGQVSLQLRKWADAKQDFDLFLRKNGAFRNAYVQRAAAWEGQQNYRAAVSDLTRALDLGPPAPELLFLRVELMEKSNDKQGAERDRIRLLASEPEQLDGWIYRGMVQAKHNPKAALADLERALAVDPNNVMALYQKALLLADRLDRPKEAVGALNRLLIADRDHADARLKRGLLYAKLEIRANAIADAETALRRDVTPARCYQAACIYAFTSKEEPEDRVRVLELLEFALRNGYANDQAKDDPNLPLAHIPEAADLLRAAPFLGRTAPIRAKS